MESWRKVWRDGFAPLLGADDLESLATALRDDDPRLTQASTTTPPPLTCVADYPCERACVLGWTEFRGEFGSHTVAQVEARFSRLCFDADKRLGSPADCRHFLNWFDDTPRDEMRRELLAEVELALTGRVVAV